MSDSSDPTTETSSLESAAPSFRVPLALSLALTAAALMLSCWAIFQLPAGARVPMHWNAQGQVDGYAGRGSLFLMPATIFGLTLMFVFLPRIEPRRGNLLKSSKAYKAVWLATLTFLCGMHGVIVLAALGRTVSMNTYCVAGMGALFVVLGNYLGKIRSNFVFGVRTPWTLTSELSWNKTHRLAGWMFVIFGFVCIAVAFAHLPAAYLLGTILGFGVLLLVTIMAYSYLVWRCDPNKTTSAQDAGSHR